MAKKRMVILDCGHGMNVWDFDEGMGMVTATAQSQKKSQRPKHCWVGGKRISCRENCEKCSRR